MSIFLCLLLHVKVRSSTEHACRLYSHYRQNEAITHAKLCSVFMFWCKVSRDCDVKIVGQYSFKEWTCLARFYVRRLVRIVQKWEHKLWYFGATWQKLCLSEKHCIFPLFLRPCIVVASFHCCVFMELIY